MVATSRSLRDELVNFLTYLVASEIALYANHVSGDGDQVSWKAPGSKFLEERRKQTYANYRSWLENGAYSALLFDGALLQITYRFAGRTLIEHRLAWVPSPFAMDLELLNNESPVDVFDMYAAGPSSDVELKTPIHFDFDPARAADDHPTTHVSLNSSDCRIACAAPLRLGHFVEFVFRNFYPDVWGAHKYLHDLSREPWGEQTITKVEASQVHLSWAQY